MHDEKHYMELCRAAVSLAKDCIGVIDNDLRFIDSAFSHLFLRKNLITPFISPMPIDSLSNLPITFVCGATNPYPERWKIKDIVLHFHAYPLFQEEPDAQSVGSILIKKKTKNTI